MRLIVTVLAADMAIRSGRYVRLAGVWRGTDPAALARFVQSHVPAGSDVLGPTDFYYFAVENAGSHYELASRESSADWARWMRRFDAQPAPPGPRRAPASGRFLLWPADEETFPLPGTVACARRDAVAVMDLLPAYRGRVGPIETDLMASLVYPRTVLYRPATDSTDGTPRCRASS